MPPLLETTRPRARSKYPRDDLPSPEARSWRGVTRLPSRCYFTREEYSAWHKRGMIARGLVLCYHTDHGYFFAVDPPRRLKEEEEAAEVSPHETETVAGDAGACAEGVAAPADAGGPVGDAVAGGGSEEPEHPADAGEEE